MRLHCQARWQSFRDELLVEASEVLDDQQKRGFLQEMEEEISLSSLIYSKALTESVGGRYSSPVVEVAARLPKRELAATAESLVNLTVFKQRMAPGTETAGGPVDVAVISKGDGLVWVKRKHYFRTEANPQFLANYFRDEEQDATDEA